MPSERAETDRTRCQRCSGALTATLFFSEAARLLPAKMKPSSESTISQSSSSMWQRVRQINGSAAGCDRMGSGFDSSHNGGWYNKEVLKRPEGGKQPHVSCCAQRCSGAPS